MANREGEAYASGTSARHLGGSVHLGPVRSPPGLPQAPAGIRRVGIILGDMTTAIMIGATMELMWLGVNNIGAYVPPDVISGTIVGAALGIMGSTDTASAIALAVAIGIPTATLVQQLNILVMTTTSRLSTVPTRPSSPVSSTPSTSSSGPAPCASS